jgi:3D-(3,5/4)-trihydroxycyclohexane-1,2-dione acylhydrolase (decyclizing)
VKLTAAQALIRFLAAQYVERVGSEHRFSPGASASSAKGNLAGIGEALYESLKLLPYHQARARRAPAQPPATFVIPYGTYHFVKRRGVS